MICIIPFHAGDAHQVADLLIWMGQVRAGAAFQATRPGSLYCNHKLVLLADPSVDWMQVRKLREQGLRLFPQVNVIVNDTHITGWPQGANALFLRACREFHEPWLWLEPDAIPLHRDWLDIIDEDYARCGKRFMGHIYGCAQPGLPRQMLSGVAVYPGDFRPQIMDPGIAFDVAISPAIISEAAHTVRIQHFWGDVGLPPTFPKPGAEMPHNGFTLARLAPNAILFHRNKDGTLIQRLREHNGITKVSPPTGPSRGPITVRRTSALGDVLASTVVATKLTEAGYEVEFQAHPAAHCLLRRLHPPLKAITEPHGTPSINLDGAYESHPHRRELHFAQMFIERANSHLGVTSAFKARNFAPRLYLTEGDTAAAREVMDRYPRPWVVICPRSQAWANRTVPDKTWCHAAEQIQGTKFWLALHPAPQCAGIVDLHCRHFDRAVGFLGVADLVVTVDTGPMHVAAALGTPVVVVQQASSPELHLSDQRDFIMVSPSLNCLNCQIDLCPINAAQPPCQHIDPGLIARMANARLQSVMGDGLSCVVAVYRPKVEKLNRCLTHALPQVDEIVVVRDTAGKFPPGAMQHPKIRYVTARGHDMGYGRKANVGARHSHHKYIWFLNDDCYASADCAEKLLAVMRSDSQIGLVGHLLWYPDGTIQHAGTYRDSNGVGFGHIDLHARECRFKEPLEMENVTGASILLRRKAYFDVGGHNEDYYLCCEDNHLCMDIRQHGWKVFFTPHATAIHEEHQSTWNGATQGMAAHMHESCATFGRYWRWYFEHNRGNAGLGVFE